MSQPRALLVCDSPGLELFYHSALAGVGLEVISVRNGESGLAQLKSPQPVIIALDLLLPGMSGIEFIRNVRVQRSTAAPPVVILPLQDADLAAAATEAGAVRVLHREQSPVRTLALLAHAQARLRGTPTPPLPPDDAQWIPLAQEHVFALHAANHGLTRDPFDHAANRAFTTEVHGLAETLALAGATGLAELALAMDSLSIGLRAVGAEYPRSALQAMAQATDFIGRHLDPYLPSAVPSACGRNVLIVDDEVGVCQLVSAAVELAGLHPHIAASPSACLEAVAKSRFDLVVLDIGLPEMSGFDVCAHIRSAPGHEAVPILFLTGMSSFQNRAKSAMSGGNDFIAKPFHPLELALKILLWVHQRPISPV